MPNPARRAVALAVLAVAIVAGAVALDLPSAAAQSDATMQSDEQAGRIVARRLDDGRTEFGWQPTGAARVLPSARYFPRVADVDRWLRSAPVEVEGVAIGRINARLLADGRIEFGFTPTDGARILPQSRYFPRVAAVNRWLRSTEITISTQPTPPDPPLSNRVFSAVSAGYFHTCGLRESGAIECWGSNLQGQSDAPAGSFSAVAAGAAHTCAIRERGAIACWGRDDEGQTDAPTGSFTAVSAGGWHSCGLRESGAIQCWGRNAEGQAAAPAGSFTAVSAGSAHSCAIRSDRVFVCWGRNVHGEAVPPGGNFTAVAVGGNYTCGLRESGAIECWGRDAEGQADPPAGRFSAVSAGYQHTCAIRDTGAIECWGRNEYVESSPPEAALPASVSADPRPADCARPARSSVGDLLTTRRGWP